jgi:hypothetical protein
MPRVFKLHGDEVGCADSVAGLDSEKGLVQCLCWLQTPDRREQSLRGPVRGDPMGQNGHAVAGLLRAGSASKCHRT